LNEGRLSDLLKEKKTVQADAEEILVERAKKLRNNVGPDESEFVNQFNDLLAQPRH
jgi:hypothetical protein